jgi:hypothetical protein
MTTIARYLTSVRLVDVKVDKQQFDAMLAKLIATPASVKEGIKPTKARKKIVGQSKARGRRS